MLRILVMCVAVLLVIACGVWLVGRTLPAVREGRAEIVIDAPPARILGVIAAVEEQVDWRSGIASVERTADGWVETTARGERIVFVAEEMGEERIVLRFSSDAGYRGRWEAVLTPEGETTPVAVSEMAEVPSPLGRIVARLFFDPEAFAHTYLEALKKRSEV